MGDPRKQRKKFTKPTHPWKMDRITEENELIKKYGLKNKREVWRTKVLLRNFRKQARTLLGQSGPEVDKEAKDLTRKLVSLGMLSGESLEDVLALNINSILDRRLQTLVCAKGLANTMNEARQFVVHGHVFVGGHVVDVPGYLVPKREEDSIKLNEIMVKKVDVRGEEKVKQEGTAA
ncbi:MAG: 30S ribosomal protein S4 [Candidatus Altiarchaeota archaeon]